MAETIGTLIVTAIVDATASEAFAAAAEATYLGISGLTIIGSVAILGATVGLQYLLGQPSARDLPNASSGHQPLRQPIPPHTYAYGRCRLGGFYALFEVRNGVAHTVQALAAVRAAQFVKIYLHDDVAVLQPDSSVTGAEDINDNRYSWRGNPASTAAQPPIVIEFRLGHDSETAYDRPVAAMPDLWTNEHRGDGIASLYMGAGSVKVEAFSTVYPQGLPQPSVLGDWNPVWDPRDASQDPDDEATWQVSFNPVLLAIDYVVNSKIGLGFARAACIDPVLDQLMTEADICDALVARRDGTLEPRYQSSGFWTSQNDPASVLDGIMSACDGWYSFNGNGVLNLKVGLYRESDVTIPQAHIIGFTVDAGSEDENIVNTLEWSFTDPDNKYKSSPGLAWRDEATIFEHGIERSASVELSWVQSHAQGRRLVKRKLAQINPRRRGTLTTTLWGLHALGERWVRVQDDRHDDLADIVVQLNKATIDIGAGRMTFEWISVNTNAIDAWDPATEEGLQPSTGADNPGDVLPVPQNLHSSVAGTAITLTFDDPARADLSYVVQFRIGTGAWVQTTTFGVSSNGTTITLVIPGFSAGHTYELQAATQRSAGIISNWSASVFATT
jgi:hypothetical protein